MKKTLAQFLKEMQVESPMNRGGTIPGPGYASAGFHGYSPVGPEDSIKQAYMNFGKTAPTSAQGWKDKCPHCGAKVGKKDKLCPKCKKDLEKVPDEPSENDVDISSPS